jgi:hypothetical protein
MALRDVQLSNLIRASMGPLKMLSLPFLQAQIHNQVANRKV